MSADQTPSPVRGRTVFVEDIEVGMSRHLTRQVTDRDIELFAEATGDRNPVHLDDTYAAGTFFKGRIAHGILTAGLISALVAQELPGEGTIYLSQSLKFHAPVRPGDMVRAEATVTAVDRARRRVTLETRCLVGDTVVLTGEAQVMAPSRRTA